MTTIDIQPIYQYIARYCRMLGHTPTAEHLATTFQQPVAAMRLALASYLGGAKS